MKLHTRTVLWFTIIACLALSACKTNSITGRRQLMLVSDATAAKQSALAYNEVIKEATTKNALNRDSAEVRRVQAITNRLIPSAVALRPDSKSWQWDVNVLEDKSVNAWCMAGGKMAVYTGLIDTIRPTDDELAAVMGHEISHALLSHQAEKMSRVAAQQTGLKLGAIVASAAGINVGQGALGIADQLATIGLQLPNSRGAETEADVLGLKIAAKAGYNPRAAVTLWQKMSKAGGGGTPKFLSTHPPSAERIANLQKLAEELMPVYEQARR